jgi:hypothetical protein
MTKRQLSLNVKKIYDHSQRIYEFFKKYSLTNTSPMNMVRMDEATIFIATKSA